MKTLILCVDRDDDIGVKAEVETPIVGRRRIVEAATRLGTADPEDSDTNGLFAAVHLYDKELRSALHKGRQLEVAAITGHKAVGIRADRNLARQLDEVLELTRADEVILVSDGAEDEQIMPILTSRVPVVHVHRTIVRQAPRLEGFYYVLTRMLDDKKFARRYVLPLGIITLVWGGAFLLDWANYAWGITLGIVGLWLVVHAMHWEERMSRFLSDFAEGMRSGKVTLVANIVAIILLVVGGLQSYASIPDAVTDRMQRGLLFAKEFILYLVVAFLVRTGGLLFDSWMRDGRASVRHWMTAFSLVALGFIGSVVLEIALAVMQDVPLELILNFDRLTRLFIGVFIAMGGVILARYVRNFFEEEGQVQ